MQRSLESKNKKEAYAVFVEQGRISSWISTWIKENRSKRHFGHIHSCFRTSLNLEFEGQLIHLDGGRHGLCCFGICVEEAGMREILTVCRAGDLAVISNGTLLRIYGSGGLILLDLQGFDLVNLSIAGMLAGNSERSAAGQLQNLLEAEERSLTLGMERTPEFISCEGILTRGEIISSAVSYLYGRGQGLTPSGDDILVGYWSILQAFSGTQSPTAYRAAVRSRQLNEVMRLMSAETTDISKAYLSAAGAGYANEILLCMLRELRRAQPNAAKEYLSQLKSLGHTSGCDTIYGMYLGMKYMD
ncbi:MAG: DUF2877 domain-containing protein [Clostridiales bacterium]|nr:DUF2877 domain-containing protein [Clostridiales bacterium]